MQSIPLLGEQTLNLMFFFFTFYQDIVIFFPFHQYIFKGFVKGATSFLTLLYDVIGSEVTFCHSVFLYFLQFKEKKYFYHLSAQ